jgi:cytochrome c biogenesis protein CcmG/thiol:disulfide interchange protein DsbE
MYLSLTNREQAMSTHVNFVKKTILIISSVFAFLWIAPSFADSGTALPAFNVPTLIPAGKQLSNKTFAGKVSLLHVWASWCKYCRTEHSMLMKIKNEYNVPIYSLDYRDNPVNAKAWLKMQGNPYVLVGNDASGDAASSLGVYGTPETFVIDKHGMSRYHYVGAIDQGSWDDTLWPLIQKLMAEK